MSSTTDRHRERGQVIVIFALMLFVIVGVAALAFDVGMVTLDKRDQQNAADAAALAGARFLPGNSGTAEARARALASANGFTHGAGNVSVTVEFPTTTRIRVTITNSRPSLFAGIADILDWQVPATAMAANEQNSAGPYAMLSLHPSACEALLVEGSGQVESNGNIQVNSVCANAVRVAGSGGLYLLGPGISCNVVGGSSSGGGVVRNDCNPGNTGAAAIPDPYETLAEPPIPPRASPPTQVAGTPMAVPAGCPGAGSGLPTPTPTATAASATPMPTPAPTTATLAPCRFTGSYAGTTWRLYPGYYPGGINLEAGTFYMEPGIYYVAGGFSPGGSAPPVSFRAAGSGATVRSVAAGGTTLDRGVLIFNGEHPTLPDGQIILQGGSANINLYPLADGSTWDSMVIFQDRDISQPVEIVGGSSTMDVRGVIYAPAAKVIVQGGGSTLTMDQIIASTYSIRGSTGTIRLAYDANFLPDFSMAGLIE